MLFALGKHPPRVPAADEIELDRLHNGEVMEGNEGTEAAEGGVPVPAPRKETTPVPS